MVKPYQLCVYLLLTFFSFNFQSYIRCKHIDYCSSKEEAFYDIQLNLKGKKNGRCSIFVCVCIYCCLSKSAFCTIVTITFLTESDFMYFLFQYMNHFKITSKWSRWMERISMMQVNMAYR